MIKYTKKKVLDPFIGAAFIDYITCLSSIILLVFRRHFFAFRRIN